MAKIPTILEAGRADGKLINSNNVYDDNQKKFLSDKIKEIDNNHKSLNNTVNSLTNTVNNNKSNIEKKLEVEQTRATNAESALNNNIETEINRATVAENNLRETINNITNINEHATTAELITVNALSNSTASNVQQAFNELFKNATYAGIAIPTTNPGTPNGSVFYIATTAGIYSNFGGIEVSNGESVILKWNNGTWEKSSFKPMTDLNSVFDNDGMPLEKKLNNEFNGMFVVTDESGNAAIIVDKTGARTTAYKGVNIDNEEIFSIQYNADNQGKFIIEDENGNIGAIVDENGITSAKYNLTKKQGETVLDPSGTSIIIEDEKGNVGAVIDNKGITTTALNIVNEFGDVVKTYDSNDSYKGLRLLILGDSYSEQGFWVNGLTETLHFDDIVNLGVTNAIIKDRYADRVAHPYTSRPTSSNNTGNYNTLACQVEKLKRLMAGTDLDVGEKKLYTTIDSYPNIIIIEGGHNDIPDNSTDNYFGQFVKLVSNVYSRRRTQTVSQATLGDCVIKTPANEVDRTCFAGAYRNILEELNNIFPDAQVFITTHSIMSYWSGLTDAHKNWFEYAYRIAEQQRMCAKMASVSIIDWNIDGQINTIKNYPSGSGTANDPYVWDGGTTSPDSDDLLHPNTRGGKKYGQVAANVIKSKLIKL